VVSVWPGCAGFGQIIQEATGILKAGGLVAYPTDTLYGLAACIDIPEAVERVFAVKGRSDEKALPLLLAREEDLVKVAVDISAVARYLAETFWPGPLTLILQRSMAVPDRVVGGGNTVAVRIPHHAVPLALVAALGVPITGTSANLSGGLSPRRASDVMEAIGDKVDLVLDAGPCPGGIGSTVVDVTVEPPRMLRQGAISEAEVLATINRARQQIQQG
jgi:L-threonylcarbamoyladenylate synthase